MVTTVACVDLQFGSVLLEKICDSHEPGAPVHGRAGLHAIARQLDYRSVLLAQVALRGLRIVRVASALSK